MTRFIGIALLLTGVATTAFGTPVPEIDPGTGANALALLAGAVLVFRSRRAK